MAAAKRKATREARGTKSPKAKKAIHGNITAQLVVTPDASTAPATANPAAPAAEQAPSGGATGTTQKQ